MIFCIISFISRFNLEKANRDFSIIFHSDTILFAAKLRLLFVPYLFFCGKYSETKQDTVVKMNCLSSRTGSSYLTEIKLIRLSPEIYTPLLSIVSSIKSKTMIFCVRL